MKIAILTPEKNPYSTTFIQAHLELLQGDKVHLFGKFFPNNGGNIKFQIKHNRILKSVLHRSGLNHLYHKSIVQRQLGSLLRKQKIDVVLAEFGPVGAEVTEVCRKNAIPLITHYHGFDAHAYDVIEQYKEQYQKMFDYASSVIVVSKFMEQALMDMGCSRSKLLLNPYGPRREFLELQPKFKELNFVSVGRFVDKKAPYVTIKAFHKVVRQHPQALLKMVGDGPLLESSKELVQSLNLQNSIKFTGALGHDEVKSIFEDAICFVQHSVVAPNGDSEGTPVAILEAGAAGLPVVSTRHAGIVDVVVEGETGFLVDEQDEAGFAEALMSIADDIKSAQAMGQKARERVSTEFSIEQHIDRLQEAIDNV